MLCKICPLKICFLPAILLTSYKMMLSWRKNPLVLTMSVQLLNSDLLRPRQSVEVVIHPS